MSTVMRFIFDHPLPFMIAADALMICSAKFLKIERCDALRRAKRRRVARAYIDEVEANRKAAKS